MGRPRLGLLARISLALLLVGLLPLAVAGFRLLQVNREAMTEQVLRTHAVAAKTTAARVESFLAARRFVAERASASAALAANPRSSSSAELLSELLGSGMGIAAVSLRDAAGEEVIRAQRSELAEAMTSVLAAPTGEELVVVRSGGSSWLRYDLPLRTAAGRVAVVCDLAPLEGALQPKELGEHAALVMVDRQGRVVAGGDLERFPESLLEVAGSGRVSGSGRFAGSEEAVLGAYAPVVGAPWIVLSRQSARVAEATAQRLRSRGLFALAVAVLLTLLMTAVARRSIVGPIRSLVAAQRRLTGAGSEPVAAGGEIEQLKASFALLERRLRDREALGELSLGRYQVETVVGEGAMGTVFRGWDPALKRPVAIKTVRFDRWLESDRVEAARRLLDEAVTVARFNHPNIVGLYDIQESPEVAFLAMEYVDGSSLEHHIQARGLLSAEETVPIALAIAQGLAAAHAREVVHHDIKPANVLLGRDGTVKVVDFGISQVISSLTAEPDALFGTPGFIPPESLHGAPHGPGGDLFALGVTLYRMLTGEMPFTGTSLDQLLRQTLTATIVPPGARVPGIPRQLDALVMSLLERDPSRRCPSAEEAIRQLEELAAQLGSPPAPTEVPDGLEPETERTVRMTHSRLLHRPTGRDLERPDARTG